MGGQIELLIPGLFDLPERPPEPRLRQTPALYRLLRDSRRRPNDIFTLDESLLDMLEAPQRRSGFRGMPVAAAFAERGEESASVLIEPVHLRPDMQRAIVVPVGREARDLDEFRRMIDDLQREFSGDFDCRELGEGAYLLRLRKLHPTDRYPHLLSVLGKPANPHIERGAANLDWYRLQTEIQMFLHQHEINTDRQGRAVPTINSLWFWGAGEPLAVTARARWYCDDRLLAGYFAQVGLECRPLESLADDAQAGDVNVVDLRLLKWLKTGAGGDLQALLEDIDERLLGPALARVAGRKQRLVLRSASRCDYLLGPRSRLCFWRRWRRDPDPARGEDAGQL